MKVKDGQQTTKDGQQRDEGAKEKKAIITLDYSPWELVTSLIFIRGRG